MFGGTLGPNDIVFVPAGWLCAERTLASSAFGLRRTWCTDIQLQTLQHVAALDGTKEGRAVKAIVDACRKAQSARPPAAAAAAADADME